MRLTGGISHAPWRLQLCMPGNHGLCSWWLSIEFKTRTTLDTAEIEFSFFDLTAVYNCGKH